MERVSARISERARGGWDRISAAHGVTFTALVEALGLSMDDRSLDLPADVVERARAIDRERFSRR